MRLFIIRVLTKLVLNYLFCKKCKNDININNTIRINDNNFKSSLTSSVRTFS